MATLQFRRRQSCPRHRQLRVLPCTHQVMLRLGLIAGNVYPNLAEHMGNFCARTLYSTSLFALDSTRHRSVSEENT